MAQINEMQPTPVQSFGSLFPDLALESRVTLHYAALAGLLLVPGWVKRRDLVSLGLFVLGLALAFNKRRFGVEFLILAVPVVAAGVAQWRAALGRRAGCGTCCCRWPPTSPPPPSSPPGAGFARASSPASTARSSPWARSSSCGRAASRARLHCEPTIAGYVTWNLYRRIQVFMDMRTPEPFGAQSVWLSQVIGEAVSLERAAPLGIELFLVTRTAPLAARLRGPAGAPYVLVYLDESFLLFAHERLLGGDRAGLRVTSGAFLEALQDGQLCAEGGAARSGGGGRASGGGLAREPPRAARSCSGSGWREGNSPRPTPAPPSSSIGTRAEGVYPSSPGWPSASSGGHRRRWRLWPAPTRSTRPSSRVSGAGRSPPRARTERGRAEGDGGVQLERWTALSGSTTSCWDVLRFRTRHLDGALDAFERARWLMAPSDPARAEPRERLAAALRARGRVSTPSP
jgi:hypothetical protein